MVRSGRSWDKRKIRWAVVGASRSMTKKTVEKAMEEAFQKWSDAIPNTFKFEKAKILQTVSAFFKSPIILNGSDYSHNSPIYESRFKTLDR